MSGQNKGYSKCGILEISLFNGHNLRPKRKEFKSLFVQNYLTSLNDLMEYSKTRLLTLYIDQIGSGINDVLKCPNNLN